MASGFGTSSVACVPISESLRYELHTDFYETDAFDDIAIANNLIYQPNNCLGIGTRLEYYRTDRFGGDRSTWGWTSGVNLPSPSEHCVPTRSSPRLGARRFQQRASQLRLRRDLYVLVLEVPPVRLPAVQSGCKGHDVRPIIVRTGFTTDEAGSGVLACLNRLRRLGIANRLRRFHCYRSMKSTPRTRFACTQI